MKRILLFLWLAGLPAWAQFGNATRIQSRPMSPAAPADTNVIVWDAALGTWKPGAGGGSLTVAGSQYSVQVNNGSGGLGFGVSSDNAAQFTVGSGDLLVNTVALATPSAPTVTQAGTPGTTNYAYAISWNNAVGSSITGAAQATATGPAALDGTNYNIINPGSCPTGATSYSVFRTTNEGSVPSNGLTIGLIPQLGTCGAAFHDTGLDSEVDPFVTDTSRGIYTTQRLRVTGYGDAAEPFAVLGQPISDFTADMAFAFEHAGAVFSASGSFNNLFYPLVAVAEGTTNNAVPTAAWILTSANGSGNQLPLLVTGETHGTATLNNQTHNVTSRIIGVNPNSTLTLGVHFDAQSVFAVGPVTNLVGYNVEDWSTKGSTSTSGFKSLLNAGTGVLGFNAAGTATNRFNGPVDIAASPFIIELPNSSTGTTNNKLAKVVNTAGVLQAQIITTSAADQAAAIGCVVSGGGTSGTALIMIAGTGSCYFDGATTAGHIAVPSATSAGALHDTGSNSSPSSGEVMATVGATDACGSPPCLIAGNLFMTPDTTATGGNGNGGGNGGNNGAKQQAHSFICNIGSATGTTVISTGDTGCYGENGPFAGTINRVDVIGNAASLATCSITVDIWKANAAYPTSGNKISASAPATLTTAKVATSGSLSGWGTSVAANDVWGASVATVTGCVYAQVKVYFQ